MKKCPTCQKTFDGAMRFCQTDGTPLVEVVEEKPIDPLKTMVVGPNDLPELAKADPLKDVVSPPREEDILQIPERYDPMKTMVASDIPKTAPASPSEPVVRADSSAPQNLNDTLAQTPDLPKFNEPSLAPPDMGDLGGTPPPPIGQKPPVSEQPKFESAPLQPEVQSPFEMPKSSPETPSSPFNQPPPSPFAAKDEPMFGGKEPPFEKSPFGQPHEPLNRPSAPASPVMEAPPPQMSNAAPPVQEWAPPPAPVAEWQEQGLGQNTPFQPPVVSGGEGQNKTMAIVSLVVGILSCLCCFSIITGPVALVLGFIAKGNISKQPDIYGGSGLALGGMITGAIGTLIGILAVILQLTGALANLGR